jgi:hypothetical protein
MAKQTFTTGQTLTAAQMTSLQANDYNWTVSAKTANYVLVAADAGTTITMNSASATTITVNTSLFTAGDTLRIQNIGAGACVVTAGTATVTSAGSLSLAQWAGGTLYFTTASAAVWFPGAGGTSGLTCVKAETTVTATNSVTADSVFTSSYTNYLLLINYTISGAGQLRFKLRTGGTSASTNYNFQTVEGVGSSITTSTAASQTSYLIGGYGSGAEAAISAQLFGPQLAKSTTVFAHNMSANGVLTAPIFDNWYGNHSTATAYDGIEIFTSGTNWTGVYAIYGYSKSL